MTTQGNQASPAASPDALLADLLSSFGKLPPKAKRQPAPRKSAPPPLPLPQAFSVKRTGYRTWKATSRVLQVQKQICNCCGAEVDFIRAQYYALENGKAHATWLRPEGYGIEAPDDLPISYVDLDPQYVPACAHCRSTPFDDLELLFHPRQLSLEI